ncbi:hypothetical protein [Ramlibacter rhizophilus]|uniref:Uncharacterized protein n=1 Tax=Ramlibacter rhizophilus TaxID=1781167 RepID=A0A4Z0C255_9BURK|nr:hypothetical protein [Ramlibacter rhizophilus]TFZ04560.1 hypothetical protein EZ242_02085 [Ramlibacter rhizophilus]
MAFSTGDAPEQKQTLDTSWQLRVEQQRNILDRAIARGEAFFRGAWSLCFSLRRRATGASGLALPAT